MPRKKVACVGCGEPCEGEQCWSCYKKWLRSPEGRARQSEASMAAWQDPEFRRNQSVTQKVAQNRAEVRQKNAEAQRRHDTPESRARRSRVTSALWRQGFYDDPKIKQRHSMAVRAAHSRGCWKGIFAGENNPNWRGGTSPHPPEFSAGLKRSVRDRDNHICMICGVPEDGQAHDVHHRDYDKGNNNPDNLVTLCKSCHAKTTDGDRVYWQNYFSTIWWGADRWWGSSVCDVAQ